MKVLAKKNSRHSRFKSKIINIIISDNALLCDQLFRGYYGVAGNTPSKEKK
jgi:hypothetical protein